MDKFCLYLIIFIKIFWGCLNINREFRVNQEIQVEKALVVDENGNKLGVIPVKSALESANLRDLDLVQVSLGDGRNKPSVCKIMDYGKYCYEQDKKDKESKKNQKIVTVKEIRLSINIGENDFQTKVNQAISFLEKDKKVKVSIRFRGRENNNPSRGYENMQRFAEACSSFSVVESHAKFENRTMIMFLSPKQISVSSLNKDDEISENK